jgi:hypothetical protein
MAREIRFRECLFNFAGLRNPEVYGEGGVRASFQLGNERADLLRIEDVCPERTQPAGV